MSTRPMVKLQSALLPERSETEQTKRKVELFFLSKRPNVGISLVEAVGPE